FMPFITEEIYHLLEERKDDLCVKQFDENVLANNKILEQGDLLKQFITGIRDIRNKQQIKPKEKIEVYLEVPDKNILLPLMNILEKQINSSSVSFTNGAVEQTLNTVIGKSNIYIKTDKPIDNTQSQEDLKAELEHLNKFLSSINKKLENEKFMQNAKSEVITLELKKKEDALARMAVIENSFK
ncbi:MAG: class I tRNA ligase family protein, partial [Ferruginibacter sp.]